MRKSVVWKEKLICSAQRAENDGLCRHKSGNFSLFDREAGRIYITPSGFYRADLKPEDIIVTDAAGAIIENANHRNPSIELGMHLAVYRVREDVCAVAHTHSPYATAFAVKGETINPVVTEAHFYGKKVELVAYAEAGSIELAQNIIEPIQKADVCLLKNHGVIAVADTIENALLKASYAEDVAKIEYLSRTL